MSLIGGAAGSKDERPMPKSRGLPNGRLLSIPHAVYDTKKYASLSNASNLHRALQELLQAQFLICTRKGGKNQASLFAFTWHAINECKNSNGYHKLDVSPSKRAPGGWHDEN